MCLGDVLGENGSSKAIAEEDVSLVKTLKWSDLRSVVCALYSLLFSLERADCDERSKYFFAVDRVVVLDVRKDRGLNKETLAAYILVGLSSRYKRRAFGLASLDVRKHALVLRLGDLRALESIVLEGVANDRSLGNILLESRNELVVDAVLH